MAGSRPGPDARYTRRVITNVDPEQYEALQALAVKEQLSLATLIRRLLSQALLAEQG